MPKFIVLLAIFNGEKWLRKQIDSILSQEGVEVKIYISFEPSVDKSVEIVEEMIKEHKNIVVLKHDLSFGSAAKNFFYLLENAPLAEFDYICFSDQDDIWFGDKLKRAHSKLAETNSSVYSSNLLALWENGKRVLIDKAGSQRAWDFLFEAGSAGCTYVLKKEVAILFKNFLINQKLYITKIWMHDWLCYAFCRSQNIKWYFDKRPSMYYRQHSDNSLGVNLGLRALFRRIRMISDGSYISQVRLLAKILELEDQPFVKTNLFSGKLGLLKLAANSTLCRRHFKEQLFFSLICIFMVLHPRI